MSAADPLLQPPAVKPARDTRLDALKTAEIFVVVSLRLWNTGEVNARLGDLRWRVGFESAGVDLCGLLAFDQLCRMLAIAASRPTQVRSLSCAQQSRDEALVVQTIAQMQRGLPLDAAATLRELCPPAAVRFLLRPAQALGASLARRGLKLPDRTWLAEPAWCAASYIGSLQGIPDRCH